MRRSIFFLGILIISFSAKSQNLDPAFVKSLKEYYFIPVEFENFGEWIAGIENDTNLVFNKKIFNYENQNDSLYLNFELTKPGTVLSIKNATLSLRILGNTFADKRLKFESRGKNLVKVIDLPPKKITSLRIYSYISFDSTSEGRLLATQTQKELEEQFGIFFSNKRIDKSNKNIKKRKFHRETERTAYFKRKDELIPGFYIRTNNFEDSNRVELCLIYELNH